LKVRLKANRLSLLTWKRFQSYLEVMKEISIKIDDELYRRASRKVEDLEAEVNQYVSERLEAINGDDGDILEARTHMAELFRATRNFGVGVRPTREEMHERGSIFNSPR
jgi:hypothetical protein